MLFKLRKSVKLPNYIILLISLLSVTLVKADTANSFLVPQQDMMFAKNYLQHLIDKNYDHVLRYIDKDEISAITHAELDNVVNLFPSGDVISTELIGSHVNVIDSVWNGNFVFEYQFESGWVVANVVIKKIDDEIKVLGFYVTPTKASQKELNKFELAGKSALHYLVLFTTVFVFLFILVTLVICIKTPIPRRKWIWVLFVLGGIGSFSLNWTSGAYAFKLIELHLVGVGIGAANEYAPWVLNVGFPLGAILFWLIRGSFIRKSELIKSQEKENQALLEVKESETK